MTAAEFVASPDERVVAPAEKCMAVAVQAQSYAYQFIDVGDPDHLVEVRCFHDRGAFELRVVDRRGRKIAGQPAYQHVELPHAPGRIHPIFAALIAGGAGLGLGELLLRLF